MKRKIYSASSPTRVDLAGGTLDLWPLWAFLGTCTTLNVSISIQTHAELTERSDTQVELDIQDLKFNRIFPSLGAVLSDPAPELRLLKAHLGYWKPERGFKLVTRSESPVGGGLGGSSSLSITLIKVLKEWLGKTSNKVLTEQQMVTLAQNLEAQVLHVPTGVQDYYPAVQGGLHIIEFTALGAQWRRLVFDEKIFRERSFLVYTGKPHQSGINNWQVLKESVEKRAGTIDALSGLKTVSNEMLNVVSSANWDKISEVLRREYELRLKLSPVFSSPEIERLNSIATVSGAEAIKICGAGGGGCVWIWTGAGKRSAVMQAVEKAGFQILNDVTVMNEVQSVQVREVGEL